MKAAPAVGFRYRASRLLLTATFAVAVLAVIAIWISGAPGWLHGILIAAVAVYATAAVRNLVHPRVASLAWRADGGVDIRLRAVTPKGDGDVQGAVSGARVMGPLIVLSLRWPPRERATLWLLPDNLDAETRRRLRMRLGAGGMVAPASGNADSG